MTLASALQADQAGMTTHPSRSTATTQQYLGLHGLIPFLAPLDDVFRSRNRKTSYRLR